MIVIINILMGKMDKIISKISVEIKRFIKQYVVPSLYHATFLNH